jgi:hypothetical protein
MRDSDKKALVKYYIPKIMKMYPDLFEFSHTRINEPILVLKDSNISPLYFRISEIGVDKIYIKTYCSNYGFTLSTDVVIGEFTILDNYTIPESSCIGLFMYNIDIKYLNFFTAKMEYYDRVSIMRKNTLNTIINE